MPQDVEASLRADRHQRGFEAVACYVVAVPRAAVKSARSDTHKRLLLALVAEEPTVGLNSLGYLRSCVALGCGRCANRLAAQEDVDDNHRRAAVPAREGRRPGVRRRVIAGVNDCRNVQQRPYPRQVLPPHRIGKQVVTRLVAELVESGVWSGVPHRDDAGTGQI